MSDEGWADKVRRKAARLSKARRRTSTWWRHVANVGALGWMLVVPTVVGAMLGRWGAQWFEMRSLTLVGLGLGLAVGLYTTGWHVRRSLRDDEVE